MEALRNCTIQAIRLASKNKFPSGNVLLPVIHFIDIDLHFIDIYRHRSIDIGFICAKTGCCCVMIEMPGNSPQSWGGETDGPRHEEHPRIDCHRDWGAMTEP